MGKRAKVTLISAIIIILALAAVSLYLRKDIKPAAAKGGSTQHAATIFAVETGNAKKGDITDYVKINGDVEPVRNIDIYPDTAGKLSRLSVSLGDSIRTGQVIAEIDPSKPGLSYALSPVRSTITGTVTSLPYEVGATITTSTAVAKIGDLSLLQIKTEIAEPYVGKIKIGTTADITFVAWPDKTFNAHIVEISPVVNNITRTISIKLEFDKNYPELKAGMFASIKLLTETRKNVILIPAESVVLRDGGKYIFIAQDNKAVMTEVATGLSVDGITEIIYGISADTEIVVKGQNLLDDGADINILNKESVSGGNG